MRHVSVLLALSLAAVFAGCGGEPAEEETKKPEPPPVLTCEQLEAEFRNVLNPLIMAANSDVGIEDGVRAGMVSSFSQMKTTRATEQNLGCALDRIAKQMETFIRDAQQYDRWRVVKGSIQIWESIKPGDTRYDELERKTDLILARPVVKVDGFFEVSGHLYAFLEVRDKQKGEIKTYKVREGEEFHDILRLERIIGNRERVEVWYEPLNDTWEIPGPRAMNTSGRR